MALLIRRLTALAAVLASVALGPPAPARAQVITQDEALRLAFADADSVVRRTAYMDEAQISRARALAGPDVPVETSVVPYYVAFRGGAAEGVAYFDAHRVRTMPEVLMIVVGVDGRVRRMEVVRFSEPPEYRPPQGWLDQFHGAPLDGDLSSGRRIANLTGATLTARAATAAARRALALHAVIAPFAAPGTSGP